MKSFNELRNEINEAKKKKPCTDCEKKEKAAAKAAAEQKTAEQEAAEQEAADEAAHLADQEQVGPKSGSYRIP